MAKYRKRPVIIDAFQITDDNRYGAGSGWPGWLVNAWFKNRGEYGSFWFEDASLPTEKMFISTLEGVMSVAVLDYIIRGIDGELYPCKPGIFEKTYELVKE